MATPHLLVLGHITRDELAGEHRLGGAAAFAARTAACLGVPAALVTAAPARCAERTEIEAVLGLDVHCADADRITTFVLEHCRGRRRLWLRSRAPSLTAADVPLAWRDAPIAYVAPVAGECDRCVVEALRAPFIGVGLQGWLRRVGPGDAVEPAIGPEATDPPALRAAVLSEEDHPDAGRIAAALARRGAYVALTRGARGVTVFGPDGGATSLAAAPAVEHDATGAGDVFGVVWTLELARGTPPESAATRAALAAARSVEGPGLGRLPDLGPAWWSRR